MGHPVLKNKYVPQEILPVAATRYMFLPLGSNCLDIKQPVPLQALHGKQVLSPLPKLASEPAINRYAKSHLWTLNHRSRNILIKHLSKRPFALAVTDLETHRHLPGKLHYSVVQNRYTRLKTYRHACSIHLGQNVIRQVMDSVGQHHYFFHARQPLRFMHELAYGFWFARAIYHI